MFGLVLMGEAEVGKYAFVDNGQLAHMATDTGVGVVPGSTTVISEEWTIDQLIDNQGRLTTIKAMAIGEPTCVPTPHPLWYGLTTNDTYRDLETKTSGMATAHKNALMRRFIWLEWDPADVQADLDEETDVERVALMKNNKLTRALMAVELLQLTRDNEGSVLNTFEPIRNYIKQIYRVTYSRAKALLLEYRVYHTEIVLVFKDDDSSDDSSDEEGEPPGKTARMSAQGKGNGH